jgi:ABC-2 type transport system permease protein
MNSYLALFSARARLLFQYRTAALAGLATQLFWGMMKVMILTAFYESSSTTTQAPITLHEAITYIWLSQCLLSLLPWNLDREIEQLVRSGNIVYELIKPLNLYWYWFSRAAALRSVPGTLRALPVAIFAGLFFGFSPPPTFESGMAFAISLVGALAISAAITTLVMTSLFWTVTGEGITRLMPHITSVLSGLMIPLPLYPTWAQPILNFLPFKGILDTPFQLYSGHVHPPEAFPLLLHQWVWVVVLILYGQWLMSRATHRLEVNGG